MLTDPELRNVAFREGALQSGLWIAKEVAGMLQRNLDEAAVADHVRLLTLILLDWREGKLKMRDDGPWDWPETEIISHIEQTRQSRNLHEQAGHECAVQSFTDGTAS